MMQKRTFITNVLKKGHRSWYNYKETKEIEYFQSKHIKDIKTSVLFVNNQPNLVTLDYEMDVSDVYPELEDSYK